MKYQVKKIAEDVNTMSPSPVGGADPLPHVGAPTPPGDRVDVNTRRNAPPASEIQHGTDAAAELRSNTRYSAIFGEWAPKTEEVANAIDFACQWYAQVVAAEAWLEYARGQTVLAWQFVEPRLALMRQPLQLALKRDPKVGTELKNFVSLALGRSQRASRASANKEARTRSAKRAAAKKEAPPVEATPPAAPAAEEPAKPE